MKTHAMENKIVQSQPGRVARHSFELTTERAIDTNPTQRMIMTETIESRVERWLDNMGLAENPFQHLDAGADWNIPYYLIDHQQFDQLLGDQSAFVFAPLGGGKTAFRVRLARECRTSDPRKLVFPIIHKVPPPNKYTAEDIGEAYHLEWIGRSAAQELLLYLVYHSTQFNECQESARIAIRAVLDWNLEQPLQHYLARLVREGSARSLIETFDRSHASLPNPPKPQELAELCEQLSAIPLTQGKRPDAAQRSGKIFDLLLGLLHFNSIYLLIDGVDGYFETANDPQRAMALIEWLLKQTLDLAEKRIYCKYFLPDDLQPILTEEYPKLLTSSKKIANIKWDAETLIAVVQQRLREASGNRFDSLRAISNRELRGADDPPEATIVRSVIQKSRPGPREVIKTIQRLFYVHIESDPQAEKKLSPRDLQAALNWYNRKA